MSVSSRSKPAVSVTGLSKTFRSSSMQTRALQDVSLEVHQGEMVALIGASGSGKSTLLRHLNGLVTGDAGPESRVDVMGQMVQGPKGLARDIRHLRREIGFIFQQFNLVGRLSLLTNVCLGMISRVPAWRSPFGWFTRAEKQLAMAALERVGMAQYAAQRASTLSGGQQQRAAIARAIVQGAGVLFADEPIASLDPASSHRVMETLQSLNADGVTVVVCLHQVEFARTFCPRAVALRAGVVVYDGPSETLTDAFLQELYGGEAADATFGIRQQDALVDSRQSDPDMAPVLVKS